MPALGDFIEDFFNRSSMPNTFSSWMGNKIREAREEMRLSQEELGKKIYKRRASISEMENGKMFPSSVDLAMMASVLKKPLSYFIVPNLPIPHDGEVTGDEAEVLKAFRSIREEKNRKQAIRQLREIALDEADPNHLRYTGNKKTATDNN